MKRLIITAVLLVVMAACCVPVYAASKSRLVFDNYAFESVPASLDGEYVYSVSGNTKEEEAFDFTVTVVREDGKVTEMTSTAPDGFMQIENYSGDKWWWKGIPFGDYLIREVARPDAAKLYKLETTDVSVEKEDDISVENGSARFRIEKYDVELKFTYRLRHDSPAISLSTEVLHPYAGLEGARTLFFGGESWIVIAYKSLRGDTELLKYKDDSLYPEDSVTLLKSDVTKEEKVEFNRTDDLHSFTNCYGWRYDSKMRLIQPETPSTLREFIENHYIGGFSAAEQAAILPRILEGGGSYTPGNTENKIRGEGVGDAMFWPLSIYEAHLVRVQKRTDYDWWLRTPGKDGSKAQYVSYDGDNPHYYDNGIEVNNREICARPAFNLNEGAVIMTSAAAGGKKSGDEGPDALTEVETKEYTEWKVTVKSDELAGFKVDQVESCNGDNLYVKYSGAAPSPEGNSFISAVIVNGDDVKYYGRIKTLTSEDDKTGEVLINLKGKMNKTAGDKIKIFNELFNGDRKTDYASDLKEVAIPPESEYKHVYKDATCTEPKTCVRCGAKDGKALGHSFTKYESNNDATCTKDGTKSARCDRCDAIDTVTDEGTVLGHSFTKYESNNDATCTKDGTKTAKCDRCDATDTQPDTGSVLGHSFTKYVSNDDATCTKDGTKTAKCDRCDVTDTVTDEGSALGHKWKPATCTDPETCSVCNSTQGSPLGHSFTKYESNNDATCTEDGTKTAKCDRCEATDTVTDEGSALGHRFGDWQVTLEPTCSAAGEEFRVCERDASHVETREMPIDPDAHNWSDWEVTKEPEPNKNGKRQRKCSICGKTESENIAASGKLLAKMTSKGKNSLVIKWNKVSGAAGYEVYFAKCNHKSKKNICKKVKTVEAGKTLKCIRKKLKKKLSYKAFVMAYKVVDGSRVYTDTSLTLHTFTAGGNKNYTNPKKVTVKKSSCTIAAGTTAKIKAKVIKKDKTKELANHTARIRYISSNKSVATVNKKGIIKAKETGSCKIYVVASNGVKRTVKVKVE